MIHGVEQSGPRGGLFDRISVLWKRWLRSDGVSVWSCVDYEDWSVATSEVDLEFWRLMVMEVRLFFCVWRSVDCLVWRKTMG